ncbi:MAG: hypothetical protein GY847_32220, partial [Proteobacteria bacterium]|nr:hypothetical protein [Pseudomonadota bacterium]
MLRPFWSFPAKIRSSLGVRRRLPKYWDVFNFETKPGVHNEVLNPSGDQRRYTLVAVDSYDQESTPRSVTLPVIRAELAEGSLIRRGIMNHV